MKENKSIFKTKNLLIFFSVLLSASIIFYACKNNEEFEDYNSNNSENNSEGISLSYSIDGKTNIINEHPIVQDFFEWTQIDSNQKGNVVFTVGNVAFDLSTIPTLQIQSKTEDTITFEMDGRLFKYTDIRNELSRSRTDTISLRINTASGREFVFNAATANKQEIPDFYNFVNSGDHVSIVSVNGEYYWKNHDTMLALPFWPFFWGLACLVADFVDHQCDKIVEEGVAECTRQGKGSVIGFGHCSVTCVDLTPQR